MTRTRVASVVLLAVFARAIVPTVFPDGLLQSCSAGEKLTYADLIKHMLDLERLAELPNAGETCRQWSSYDRASRYDEAKDQYINWAANGDGDKFIREENGQYVLAEMEGPGCIWRIWSALAEKGHVRIYLDGNPQPVVDLPFEKYFDGQTPPFNYPMLSYNLAQFGSRGQNLYFPIPYQRSCKIVAEKGWGRYYHIVYTTYPKDTQVPTFSPELAKKHQDLLQQVNDFFAHRLGEDPKAPRAGQRTISGRVTVAARSSKVLELKGPAAITAIRGRVDVVDRTDQMAALRRLVLSITWDDQKEPAVWCPVGDFFGTAPGVNYYRSLVTGMTKDSWYALWYMPFAKRARIELINQDDVDRHVYYQVTYAPLQRPFEGLGYFHCKWHRDAHEVRPDRWPDWVMLRTEGRGRYCGVMLHVWNPLGGWWGEGDEKFFVDGEKFPSTFGTGSEDYFGYAWCNPTLFERPYHCQTMTQQNKGHQSVLRWHIVDNVPFQQSFEACIEKYYGNEDRGTLYACTVCWYLSPDGVDPYRPVPPEQRHDYYRVSPIVAGGIRVLEPPPGNVQTQQMVHFKGGTWRNNDQLWWTGAKPGDRLKLALPVEISGNYRLRVVLTKARDYAIVQFYLDGQKIGPVIDLYSPDVTNTEPIELGTFELAKGEHVLAVEIVGKNPQAIPAYMFGMDYFECVPVNP